MLDGTPAVNVQDHYLRLKEHLTELSNEMQSRNMRPEDLEIVNECLVSSLEKIMFLFKDYSYHMEEESRLVISRDIGDTFDIIVTKQSVPLLFINPSFQVYPDRVLIGPKVENPDFWIPEIQYELNKIKEKWNCGKGEAYNPVVEISRINIR